MSLLSTLQADLLKYRKENSNPIAVYVLSRVLNEVPALQRKQEPSNTEISAIIYKCLHFINKKIKDYEGLAIYEEELKKYKAERAVLSKYVQPQFTEAELRERLLIAYNSGDLHTRSSLLNFLHTTYPFRYDNTLAISIINEMVKDD